MNDAPKHPIDPDPANELASDHSPIDPRDFRNALGSYATGVTIITVAGADYVGPLPKELQDTVKFAAALLTVSKETDVARAFLKFIASPEAAALIRKSSMEPWG